MDEYELKWLLLLEKLLSAFNETQDETYLEAILMMKKIDEFIE